MKLIGWSGKKVIAVGMKWKKVLSVIKSKKIPLFLLVINIALLLMSCSDLKEQQNVIALDYFNSSRHTATIIEDNEFVYYAKKDGIYKRSKKDEQIQKLCTIENADYLHIHEEKLYFMTDYGTKIKEVSKQGGTIGDVLVRSDSTNGITAASINDYMVQGNKIYILSDAILMIYDLNTKSYMDFQLDCSQYQVVGNKIYYLDHANRTFTLYATDIDSGKSEIIAGEGIPEPESDLIRDFVIRDSEIYILTGTPVEGYLMKMGENIILDEGNIDELRIFNENLYYIEFGNEVSEIKVSEGSTIRTVAELPEYDRQKGFCVANECVYFNSGYTEYENNVGVKLYDYQNSRPQSIALE